MHHDISAENRSMALNVLKMMRPYKMAGRSKIRVGRLFDGGYVMLDNFEGVTAAYSLGINDDVSWDLEMARRGIPVFQYDHTIERLPSDHPLFHWERVGISGHPDSGPEMASIEDLVQRNGHGSERNLLLKCDIEGAEWLVLRNTPISILNKFSQIVLELHNMSFLSNYEDAENVRATISNLMVSHRVVHVHANNYAPWVVVGGIPIPNVLELTLVRIDEGELSVSDEVFPTPLDMPCNGRMADLYLGRFEFS